MAVLTSVELAKVRSGIASAGVPVNYDKPTVNAAVQALENWFETTGRGEISAVLNTATAPVTLTAAQKKALVGYWLQSKFDRGG